MTTIYAVSKGQYSDYSVVAVFSTREKAQAFLDEVPKSEWDDWNGIEEYDLDPPFADISRTMRQAGKSLWRVFMFADGSVRNANVVDSVYSVQDQGKSGDYTESELCGGPRKDILRVTIWATDWQHAVKIANEKRTQMIASGKWTP